MKKQLEGETDKVALCWRSSERVKQPERKTQKQSFEVWEEGVFGGRVTWQVFCLRLALSRHEFFSTSLSSDYSLQFLVVRLYEC